MMNDVAFAFCGARTRMGGDAVLNLGHERES
jgi:hypothetical protein